MNDNKIKDTIISSISWSAFAHFIKQFITFIIGIILARLLTPEDFGLIAMIVVFTGFANLFTDFGFGSAIIYEQSEDQELLSSIFWIVISVGFLLTTCGILLSPLIAYFYQNSILKPLTMLLCLNFIFNSLNSIPNSILQKNFKFRELANISISTTVIGGLIGIYLAIKGYGVWSLALSTVIGSLTNSIFLLINCKWRPTFTFNYQKLQKVLSFGSNLVGHRIINYWARNIDNLLIGKYIGASSLGIYNRAYNLMRLPVQQISQVLSRAMFSSFSKIKDDKLLIKEIYLKSISIIALVSFPLMLGLLAISDMFIISLYGEKWKDVIPIIKIFCIIGLTHSIETTTGWIYLSQGKTDWQFRWEIYASTVKTIGIIIGIKWGIIGVAYGYTISSLVFILYPGFKIPGSLINLKFSEVVRSVIKIFICSIIMSLIIWCLGFLLPDILYGWHMIGIQVVSGIIIYILLLTIFQVRELETILRIIREKYKMKIKNIF